MTRKEDNFVLTVIKRRSLKDKEKKEINDDTISLVMGSLFLRREVTTSTMASCSFGNLCSSCGTKHSEHSASGGDINKCDPFFDRAGYLRAVVAAVLDDPLHLLVDQLHAAQTGLLQAFHLLLHQQLEGNLGHKQGRAWALE